MNNRLSITIILWFAASLFAHGEMTFHSVTPEKLDAGPFTFVVSSQSLAKEIVFEITITAKSEDIPSDSAADLSIVKQTRDSSGTTLEIIPQSKIKVTKESRSWKVAFSASEDLLKNPEISFVFSVQAHSNMDGRPMPSIDYYIVKLQDFTRK